MIRIISQIFWTKTENTEKSEKTINKFHDNLSNIIRQKSEKIGKSEQPEKYDKDNRSNIMNKTEK